MIGHITATLAVWYHQQASACVRPKKCYNLVLT